MRSGSNWYQIRNKTCYIPKVSNFSVGKGHLWEPALKFHLWYVNVYFTDNNIMQRSRILKVLKCKNKIYERIGLKDEVRKNGVICVVIIFTSGVRVIKIKISRILYFLLMTATG